MESMSQFLAFTPVGPVSVPRGQPTALELGGRKSGREFLADRLISRWPPR
jgi:hypothetical protein